MNSSSTSIQGVTNGQAFEAYARTYCSHLWGVTLAPRIVTLAPAVRHSFDMVSSDGRFVGDAKCFVTNASRAPAKKSNIAEYVWLLQHAALVTDAYVFLYLAQMQAWQKTSCGAIRQSPNQLHSFTWTA